MKTKIITVANQKGGVGKTTTALAVSSFLNNLGKNVLLIDLDPQGNATLASGIVVGEEQGTYEILSEDFNIYDAIVKKSGYDIMPASNELVSIDQLLSQRTGREYKLKKALQSIDGEYDFVIIDTPPQLSTLTVNALTACHNVIIPVQADIFSMQGSSQLVETIQGVREYTNPNIEISGILLTRYSARAILSQNVREMLDEFASAIGSKLFETTIRETVVVKESQIEQKMLSEYKATASVDYKNFVGELLEVLA
ncbi:MAG: ParA family protein [Bacillota bacterium]